MVYNQSFSPSNPNLTSYVIQMKTKEPRASTSTGST